MEIVALVIPKYNWVTIILQSIWFELILIFYFDYDVTLIKSSCRQSLPVYEEQSRIEYPYFDPQKIAAGSPSQDFEKADVKRNIC